MITRRNCEGTTRRDCLKLGLHSLVAGGLVGALRTQALAADAKPIKRKAKACILVWCPRGWLRPPACRPRKRGAWALSLDS